MKRITWISVTVLAISLVAIVLTQSRTALAQSIEDFASGTLTLVDEANNPLAYYPSDFPTEQRNLSYKYRCGGSWGPTTSFKTDANGQTLYSIGCSNWDNKITMTLNQTSLEQDVTVNSTFQAAKVNANLKSCSGFIMDAPGGILAQGSGYWYDHGTTGSSGTVTFYTFPGNIKLRMGYNHSNEERTPIAISAGTNEVDFQTTKLTINYVDDIRSNKGGSWWYFSKPFMYLLPGDYPFYFKTGSTWDGPVTITVSGCDLTYPNINEPPVADPNGPYLGAVNTSIAFDGTGSSDPDGDQLTYAWVFGDSNTGPSATPTHSYVAAGIYNVCLTVNDGLVDSDQVCTIAVVYDPSGGFVTGGGWFMSPAGAYTADPDLEGKANFGFVAKYKKGANVPDGNTEFQFKAGDLNFHSTSYEWLVVAGNKAQFKGEGTINGQGSYKFMLSADDDSPDTFRIQIWDTGIVYDNGSQQALGGGNIVVHK